MKVGLIQICSVLEPETNLKKIRAFLKTARDKDLEAVFLPECFYSMSDGTKPTPYLVDGNDEHYKEIKKLATDYSLYIIGGSAATVKDGNVVNRNYNFDPKGNDLGHYDKIHLFSCDIRDSKGEKKVINESDIYVPGSEPKLIKVGPLKVGLSICFDIRYPQMYGKYVEQGANLICISAAFTVPTGNAHWHTLVRARAIENQCFIIAPAQWGKNNERIQTFGHSLIVDPWGKVLVDAKEGEKLVTAELDLAQVIETRHKIKVF
ncbi:MAG: hypothetical protein KAQ98_11060 [Bacteriovoracaceae bacterium]|nr:hypothetical protein [Bacteriovoracaceae bacterium]